MSSLSRRDEFPQKVKTTLAQRVNYLCSKPSCHEFTSGPHSDDNKPLILGVAAHICAASLGGPRYKESQTPEERRSASNGIWLCDRHAREIDHDESRFPESLLREWKAATEAFVAGENPSPSLPQISLRTLSGLRLISGRTISQENADIYRDHELIIENVSRLDMRDVRLRVQFPERLFEFATIESKPFGTAISVRAPRLVLESIPNAEAGHQGGHWNLTSPSPERPPQLRKFDVMFVDISSLPALDRIAITLVSVQTSPPRPIDEVLENNSDALFRYYVDGLFAFDWNREVRHLKTWSQLKFDLERRHVSIGPTLPSQPAGPFAQVCGGLVG